MSYNVLETEEETRSVRTNVSHFYSQKYPSFISKFVNSVLTTERTKDFMVVLWTRSLAASDDCHFGRSLYTQKLGRKPRLPAWPKTKLRDFRKLIRSHCYIGQMGCTCQYYCKAK